MSMNPCPHPVESAQRAARDLTMAWARNLTLLDTNQGDGGVERSWARADVPTPAEMAEKYIEVRDAILASPPPRPPTVPLRVVPAEVVAGDTPAPGGAR